MYINSFLPPDEKDYKLCKMMLSIIECDLLWIMCPVDSSVNILVSETSIVEWYKNKKYYLQDPNAHPKSKTSQEKWKIRLGTKCETFNKNGFAQDLDRIFQIQEFVSIEVQLNSKPYCFRFFTKTNGFPLMAKLLNDMPIIKYFIKKMSEKFAINLHQQQGIDTEN